MQPLFRSLRLRARRRKAASRELSFAASRATWLGTASSVPRPAARLATTKPISRTRTRRTRRGLLVKSEHPAPRRSRQYAKFLIFQVRRPLLRPTAQCNGRRVAEGDAEDRRGDGAHSKHRRTNQPPGSERDDRSRASSRGRQGFRVVAGEVKARSTQTANATEEIADQIQSIRDATEQRLRRFARLAPPLAKSTSSPQRWCYRGGGAGRINQGNCPQRAAGRTGHAGRHEGHCRRDAGIGPGGKCRRTGSRLDRRTRKTVRAPEARGRELSRDSSSGVALPRPRTAPRKATAQGHDRWNAVLL